MARAKTIMIKIDVSEKNASKRIQNTKKAVDDLADSTERLARANNQNRAQSGLNNAILIETGRVASDAAYGIQGIANNVGRLLELGQEFSRTGGKGGFAGAFKELGKSLMGPAGFIVGAQLLLSFLPKITKALGEWLNATTVLDEAQKQGTLNLNDQVSNLNVYLTKLNDANTSDEQRRKIVNNINEEYDGLNLKLDENNRLTEESVNISNQYIEVLKIRAQAEATLSLIQEKSAEKIELLNSSLLSNLTFMKVLRGAAAQLGSPIGFIGGVAEGTANDISELDKEIQKLIESLVVADPDQAKKGIGKLLRTFKQQLLDLSKLEEQYRQQSELTFILSQEERILKQEEFAMRDLDIRVQQFKDRQKLRLEEFLESKASDAEKEKARREYNESIIKADKEASDVLIQLKAATATKLLELEAKQANDEFKFNRQRRQLEIERSKFALDADQYYFNEKMYMLQQEIQMDELRLKTAKLSIDQRAELELKLAKMYQDLDKSRAKQRIAFIEENKRIDLEYVGFVQGIGTLLSTLAGENEALQKAALLVEKGAAIADIVIKTQAANASARAQLVGMGPILGTAFTPIVEAQIARNNIGAGIAIANILATTLMSFKKPSTGGGGAKGGQVSVEAPDFNVVGASPESQLAQTVAGQQAKPIKAFVVGKEITSQQELDRNILTTAGLGD